MEQQPISKGQYTVPESPSQTQRLVYLLPVHHQDKEYLRKYREGINRLKDKVQRMARAEELCQSYKDWLKMGWNPIIDPEFKLRHIRPNQAKQDTYLKEAMIFALSKKKLARKTRLSYRSMLDFIEEVAVKHGYDLLPVCQYDRGVCLSLIDDVQKNGVFLTIITINI